MLKFLYSRSNLKVTKPKIYHVKGLVTRNTHVKYESSITSGLKVMAKVKVFAHVSDADANGRTMTLAPWVYVPVISPEMSDSIGAFSRSRVIRRCGAFLHNFLYMSRTVLVPVHHCIEQSN